MKDNKSGTVLITGANSGLGLEAAYQLAGDAKWSRVVLGVRSEAKAKTIRDALMAATGRAASDFPALLMDLTDPA